MNQPLTLGFKEAQTNKAPPIRIIISPILYIFEKGIHSGIKKISDKK